MAGGRQPLLGNAGTGRRRRRRRALGERGLPRAQRAWRLLESRGGPRAERAVSADASHGLGKVPGSLPRAGNTAWRVRSLSRTLQPTGAGGRLRPLPRDQTRLVRAIFCHQGHLEEARPASERAPA